MSAIRTVDPPTKYISAVRAGGWGEWERGTIYIVPAQRPHPRWQHATSCLLWGRQGPQAPDGLCKGPGPGQAWLCPEQQAAQCG